MTIHITVPYDILVPRQDEIIGLGVNPEIYVSSSTLDTCQDADVRRLGDALKKAGRVYTLHAPYMDLAPGGGDSKIRRATQERLEHVLHLAALVRPEIVVFHPEYEQWRHGEAFDLWFHGSVEMWSPLVKEAERYGVTLALENVFEQGPDTIKKLLDKINSPRFGFCFDTGHWLGLSKKDWQKWLPGFGKIFVEGGPPGHERGRG